MHSNDGIKPVRDFLEEWHTQRRSFFYFTPLSLSPSLSFFPLPFFLVSVTASDSGWQPPGFLKANITAKDELQVCQTCKHALITHFPADDNEVTEIIAVFFCFFLTTPRCSGSENDRITGASLLLFVSFIWNYLAVKKQHVIPDVASKINLQVIHVMFDLLWPVKVMKPLCFCRVWRISRPLLSL